MSIRQTERLYGYLVAAKNVEIEYEHYHGSYDIEPTFELQVLETNELVMDADLYIEPIPYDQYTGSTHVTPLPNNSVTLYTEESVVMDNVIVDAIGYDISDTNVTAGDLRVGKTAIDPTGTKITGTWNPPDVSGDTVTQSKVLAGTTFHDASGLQKTGSIPTYSGSTSYNPSPYARQTISCYQKYMASDIYINKIPYDITDTNVAANKMLSGTTAISPTGVKLTGNILTYSGSTVFDPDPDNPITIPLSGKYVNTDLTINPIPGGGLPEGIEISITEYIPTTDVNDNVLLTWSLSDAPHMIFCEAIDSPPIQQRAVLSFRSQDSGSTDTDSQITFYSKNDGTITRVLTSTGATNPAGFFDITKDGATYRPYVYAGTRCFLANNIKYRICAIRFT